MKQVKAFKLTDGSVIEDKDKAKERQIELDTMDRIKAMDHMFKFEIECFDDRKSEIFNEIRKDFSIIGYEIQCNHVQNLDRNFNSYIFSAYKNHA